MARILDVAAKYRSELLAFDESALSRISGVYANAWQYLDEAFERISLKIAEARAQGVDLEALHPSWVFQQARYNELMTQLETRLADCGRLSVEMIADQQCRAILLGTDHAMGLMDAGLGPMPSDLVQMGYKVIWNRLPDGALQNLVGYLGDGSPLSYKFASMSSDAVTAVKSAFTSGFAAGIGPRQLARIVQRAAALRDEVLTNALATARTETIRAYRQASHENYRANDDVVKGWIWSCAHQSRTCAACWAKDGSFHPLTEELIDHVCGRCSPIPVTKTWQELYPNVDLSGVQETSLKPWKPDKYFKQLSEKDQRAILGATRYEWYRSGEMKLSDIPTQVESATWGNSYRVGTLAEIRARIDERN